jgi:hypothetical protein
MGQGASAAAAAAARTPSSHRKKRYVTDDNEFIEVVVVAPSANSSFLVGDDVAATRSGDFDDANQQHPSTSASAAKRTLNASGGGDGSRGTLASLKKRLNELRESAPSTASVILDRSDDERARKATKSWQKVFDLLDAHERLSSRRNRRRRRRKTRADENNDDDEEEEEKEEEVELIAKLREIATAIRLASMETDDDDDEEEEEDSDNSVKERFSLPRDQALKFYENARNGKEEEPTEEKPKSPRFLSPISNTPPPPRRGGKGNAPSARKRGGPRDKNRDNDEDGDDDDEDDDEDEDDVDHPNERSVRSEYVRNTDDLLAVADRLSRLCAP